MVDKALIEEAGRRLQEAAPAARVLLFGSHARGEGDPNSDLDFLVIESEVDDRAAECGLRRALRGILAPMDIIVVSEQQVEVWGEVPGTVVHAALAEGRLVHGWS